VFTVFEKKRDIRLPNSDFNVGVVSVGKEEEKGHRNGRHSVFGRREERERPEDMREL
jgi:hypothetical protein